MSSESDRRTFLATVGATAAAIALAADPLAAAELPVSKWDLAWLDAQRGKHRQVFDLGSRNPQTSGNPLRVVKNWLNAHHEVYGLPDSALSTCVGISSDAFPINASDPLWTAYPIGEHFQIKDPETGEWARRNLWLDAPKSGGPESSVRALQARGTIFWQCNNALNGVVQELATRTGGEIPKIRADLIAGLNPGVKLVPAHTMLLGLVQERHFTYEKL
jgi:hypothetical protein